MPICQLIHLALNIHFKRLCLFHGNLDQANPSRFKINGLIATIEAKKSEPFRARNYRQCWLQTNSIHCSKQKINIQKMVRNVTNDCIYKCVYQNMSVIRIKTGLLNMTILLQRFAKRELGKKGDKKEWKWLGILIIS